MKTLLPFPATPPHRTISGFPLIVWLALVTIPARLLVPPSPPVMVMLPPVAMTV
jgi:hypothetical protein